MSLVAIVTVAVVVAVLAVVTLVTVVAVVAGVTVVLACLHVSGGPHICEVTCGRSPYISCKCVQIIMRDYMDRQVTSATWVPQPPCKQVLRNH